ncbi:MAG: response regulator [Candidatus Omnitrophica bacterium]|nr:response regulator [Candidatus Omnitrophota bacterium]
MFCLPSGKQKENGKWRVESGCRFIHFLFSIFYFLPLIGLDFSLTMRYTFFENLETGNQGRGCPTMSHNLFVIDDDPVIRSALRKLLVHQGFKVKLAKDAAEALEVASQERFDLIISDIRMPGKDGIETIREIRSMMGINHKSPVVFMTGYSDEQAQKRAMELKYVDYLLKPFDLHEFLRRVRKALEEQNSLPSLPTSPFHKTVQM